MPNRMCHPCAGAMRNSQRSVRNPQRSLALAPLVLAGLLLISTPLDAQLPPGASDATAPATQTDGDDALRLQATEALDRNQPAAALRALTTLAQHHPTDPHILFDLASTEDALDQNTIAEATYRRAIAADPIYFEPHLALGLLLARTNHPAEARTELLAAVALNTPNNIPDTALKARAYRALARVDQQQNPAEARDALLSALKLSPETPDDTALAASLAASADDPAAAEQALRRVLAAHPADPATISDLARLLIVQAPQGNPASPANLEEARKLLNTALAKSPDDPGLNAELASLDLKQGKPELALALVNRLHAADPANPAITRLYARLLLETGQPDQAEPLLAQLAKQNPTDGGLLDQYADVLIRLHRPAEAATVLRPLLTRTDLFPTPTARAEAAGRLAFAASQSNDPTVTLQALDLRATLLPQSPSSLFLAATANDKLHHTKQAAELYRQFLSAANGKFPDEEFEARHRLVTLAHMR